MASFPNSIKDKDKKSTKKDDWQSYLNMMKAIPKIGPTSLLRYFISRVYLLEPVSLSCTQFLQVTTQGLAQQNLNRKCGNSLVVKGWIKSITKHDDYRILYISNGVPRFNTKVILHENVYSSEIEKESAVVVIGEKLKEETDYHTITAKEIEVKGRGLLKQTEEIGKKMPLSLPHHFRGKFSFYTSRFRLRSELKTLLHEYFHENDYIEIDTPTITRNLRDMQYGTLHVELASTEIGENPIDAAFGHPVYLSTSGQLHLECITSGLNKVYSIGPSFRTGFSGGKYLYEFWRVDCEEVFSEGQEEGFETLLYNVEGLLKRLLKAISEAFAQDNELIGMPAAQIKKCCEAEWKRVTYAEALTILKKYEDEFDYPVKFGMTFPSKCQQALLKSFGGSPLFITEFPWHLRTFNVAISEKSNNSLTFDLLFPHTGEIASGAVREKDYNRLQERLEQYGGSDYLAWFKDMRKWGGAPTRGFCLGIDRLMHCLFLDDDIKNGIPFPRSKGQCAY